MDKIDFSEVGSVKCVLYDKMDRKIDGVVIKVKDLEKPLPLPQKVLRAVLTLTNKKRDYLTRQTELEAE